MNVSQCSFEKKNHIIQEKKTIPIIIPKPIPKMTTRMGYSLNNHVFDPSKSSPPNCFLLKLEKRLRSHYSLGIQDNKLVNV